MSMFANTSSRVSLSGTRVRLPRRRVSRAVSASPASALFGVRSKPKAPEKPPAGTPADAAAFKAAGAALALPALPAFVATEPILEAFGVSHSDPAAFAGISDIAHYSNVVGTDCFALIALCATYVLSDAAENARLDSATYQRLALALVLYAASTSAGVLAAFAVGASSGATSARRRPPSPSRVSSRRSRPPPPYPPPPSPNTAAGSASPSTASRKTCRWCSR